MKSRLSLSLATAALFFSFPMRGFVGTDTAAEREDYPSPQEALNDLKSKNIKMPTLPGMGAADWFNTGDTLNLKGKIVLVDFWDYTCVNCIRTLPYLEEWHRRYKDDGLVILGVHSPEFAFAKKRGNVAEAIKRFGIMYPVVMDNDFKIWDLFGNQYWPAKYIFDTKGTLRFVHFGEGDYGSFEAVIQKLLKEADSGLKLPSIMQPIRATDVPGAVCFLTTPETYLGYERGSIGNKGGSHNDEIASYSQPDEIGKDKFYLVGRWDIERQYARCLGSGDLKDPLHGGDKLIMNYVAAEVNLVVKPMPLTDSLSQVPFRVYVYQDGKPVRKEDWSIDLQSDSAGKTYISVDAARMYYLVKNREYGRHILTLVPTSDEFAAYAFTFVTACETN
jgi:thiol-disulfide isomerase/thioredoxin